MESRICPECLFQTDFNIENDGLTSICLNCGTRSVNIKVLKEGVSELKWNELLSKLSHPIISKKSPCKKSGCEIKGQLISTLNNQVEIDVCHQCGQIWFDQFELEECLSILEINFDQKIDPQSLEKNKKIKVYKSKSQ